METKLDPKGEQEMEAIRKRHNLARVTPELEGMPIAQLPEGVYGYSFSQPSDEMPLFAERNYQCFEWHKLPDGVIQVAGYAKPQEAETVAKGQEPIDFNLYPEPHGEAQILLTVIGTRIRSAKPPSRTNGNYIFLQVDPIA
jgi:hypothetical protein